MPPPSPTWPVELPAPGDVEHLPVDGHEDAGLGHPVVRPQLLQGEVPPAEPGQRRLLGALLRRPVPSEDLVEEEETEAEQGQVEGGAQDLLQDARTVRHVAVGLRSEGAGSAAGDQSQAAVPTDSDQ